MRESDIVILNGGEVLSLLEGKESEIVEVVGRAYEAHAKGESMLPHSMFLRFPDDERNRIIALPAYLGDSFAVAGIKWISSFPGNLDRGMERASAVVVLNSTETGRARAIIEGSAISAKRTAASAALAAQHLHDAEAAQVGLIGCGLIGFELVRFILATRSGIEALFIFDKNAERAERFKEKCRELSDKIEVRLAPDAETVLRNCPLTALATTAATPHIRDLSRLPPRSTILHVSLRDFAPEVILSCDNVADDIDHVCRAQTSVHLAEQLTGRRDFVRSTIGDILLGRAPARSETHETTIFSPFGLGILDLAVAHFLFSQALSRGMGTVVESFFPAAWTERTEGK